MNRIIITAMLGLAAFGTAVAGQIQIGQFNGSGQNMGLTQAYMAQGAGSSLCIGAVVSGNSCAAASNGFTGTFNYSNSTFQDSSGSAAANNGATAPTPYAGYTASSTSSGTSGPAGSTMSDGNVTFAMISDPTKSSFTEWSTSNNNQTPASVSMSIPIGIFGVTDAWTMLDQEYGIPGLANAATVTFTFSSGSADGSTGTTTTVVVDLNNAPAVNPGNSQTPSTGYQLQDVTNCTSGPTNTYNNCRNYATGAVSPTSNPNTYINGVLQNTGIQVLVNNLYTYTYTNAVGTQYAGTTGTQSLDDQGFLFNGAYSFLQSDYLVSIGITDNQAEGYKSGSVLNDTNLDYLQLSAVTLDSNVPEPATWALLLGSLGVIGMVKWMRARRIERSVASLS